MRKVKGDKKYLRKYFRIRELFHLRLSSLAFSNIFPDERISVIY